MAAARIVDVPAQAIRGRVWAWHDGYDTMVSSNLLQGKLVDNELHITSEACPANWLTIDMATVAVLMTAAAATDGVIVPATAIRGSVQDMPETQVVSSDEFEGMLCADELSIGCVQCPCFWLRLSVDTILGLFE